MSPLLVWALHCVLDLAPDIIDAHWAWRRLKVNIRPSNAAPADGAQARSRPRLPAAPGGELRETPGVQRQHRPAIITAAASTP
ncbi:hypothetical protein IM697_23925 [Streptomyces ferrugineus]|uniref:Uncharacterized protein n=1 Tax=Streptomyces ferrugineus TaxID=1413221 RepID=A0A7M2SCR8_9ACTN|nr:hypothetical protein [Streptomyces ferrugineus]QOV33288.1 hypothetical protein IM697_23925 [Streptomyces ferrugineus]